MAATPGVCVPRQAVTEQPVRASGRLIEPTGVEKTQRMGRVPVAVTSPTRSAAIQLGRGSRR
jgi:hypothetical protein